MSIDVSKVFEKYRGQWVAFEKDQTSVIANGRTAKEALNKAKAEGFPDPILSKMPEKLINYVG